LEADVLLAVGTRFADRSTGDWTLSAKMQKKIHIDIDPAEIGKNVDVDVPIVADAKKALRAIYTVIAEKIKKKGRFHVAKES
jgi:acetolactate synthase-1/2/3 large subunit